MQSKLKANSVITHVVTDETIVFNVKDAGSVSLDLTSVSEAVMARAALHGMIQRVSDAAALSRNTKTGLPATPKEKLAAMERLVEHYHTGTDDWRLKGEARVGDDEWLFRALVELKPDSSHVDLRLFVEARSKKEITALLLSDTVKPIVERLRGAQAIGIDTDELLAGL